MTPIESVQLDAKNHLYSLILFFIPNLAGIALFSWLSVWSSHQHSWEGEVIAIALGVVAALFMLAALISGILLFSWLRNYKYAIRDVADFEGDPERFRLRYPEVFGPIRWR